METVAPTCALNSTLIGMYKANCIPMYAQVHAPELFYAYGLLGFQSERLDPASFADLPPPE